MDVPQPINGRTIWSRLQQFASALYGPIFAAGANFWQQDESNFWGHNAIVRLTPFMKHCALPNLPDGARPMSHDFVEAALMRRAGWEVHLAPDLDGSYEETPPTVIEHLKRDRRWCQGNLQHWPLAFAGGFKPATRFHFLHGIFSFLASPLLLLLLVLGFFENLAALSRAREVADAARAEAALVLFGFTMLLLLLPKLLALALALWNGRAREFGGAAKMILSATLEILFSILIAPVFLFFHAKFVLFTWLGKRVEWQAQRRSCKSAARWSEAANIFCLTTVLGLIASLLIGWFTPGYFLWLLPILLGWLLAIPLTALSGDLTLGGLARKAGLFLVPSEVAPSREVRALRREEGRGEAIAAPKTSLLAAIDPIAQRLFPCLTNKGCAHLHRQIWATPAEDLPPPWREALARFEMQMGAVSSSS